MIQTSLETKTKSIDGVEYRVTVFPAGQGFELLFELKELFGDSIGALFGKNAETALAKIGGKFGKKEVLDFVLRLLAFTYAENATEPVGKKEVFNLHFAGRQGHLFKVIAFAVEVNFGDFFGEVKNGLKSLMDKMTTTLREAGATDPKVVSLFPKD